MQAEMRGYLAGVATPKLSPREIDRSGLAVRCLSDQDLQSQSLYKGNDAHFVEVIHVHPVLRFYHGAIQEPPRTSIFSSLAQVTKKR